MYNKEALHRAEDPLEMMVPWARSKPLSLSAFYKIAILPVGTYDEKLTANAFMPEILRFQ
jgi:hypothetical protein